MIDHQVAEGREARVSGSTSRWTQRSVLGAACALVIGVYAFATQPGPLESANLNAADSHYNLLVQGFRAGHLSLKKEVPAGLVQLADPYDPVANAPYMYAPHRLLDISYHKGRLYLYWGVTPALTLFWPYAALTGHYLFHRQAVAIFCVLGFLTSVGLLHALWRRYFSQVSVGVVAACVFALGLGTGVPVLLPRADVYEVPISCGYMLTMLALGAIWRALHESELRKRSGWLAAASVAYGLALGARPTLLFGAVILLVPVAQAWRERRPIGALLVAATGPIFLIGLGLMLYNALRFDSPFEFGLRHQLGGEQKTMQLFSMRFLWVNFRVYFLEPARWIAHSPFVSDIAVPPLPSGHRGDVERAFGILTNIPVVWLILMAPLAWRGRSAEARSILRGFWVAVGLFSGICAMTLGMYYCAAMRYEVDFLPALVLMAMVGILGLERVMAPMSDSGPAGRPGWWWAARWGWGLLLGFSVVFNVLFGAGNYAEAQCRIGNALSRAGKINDAMRHFELALRIKPDLAEAHNNLAGDLMATGKLEEAIRHLEQALRSDPAQAEIRINLGFALKQAGRLQDAIRHYEEALKVFPDNATLHSNLGSALLEAGNVQEAIRHYEQALWINPGRAETHKDLGIALGRAGRLEDAIGHFAQAVRIKPDYTEVWNALGAGLAQAGRLEEAIGSWEQAVRINPDFADAHYNLGVALEQLGRVKEATQHYQQVLRLKPNDAGVQKKLSQLQAVP